MLVNINGRILPIEKATIPITDHGLLYGYGLFETLRVYGGHLFLIEDHLRRLKSGMDELGIHFPGGLSLLEAEIMATLEANQIENGTIRLTLTAGEEGWSLPSRTYSKPSYFIMVRQSPPTESIQKKMTVLKTLRNSPEGEIRHKTLNYMNSILGKKEIWEQNVEEGLFLNAKGHVVEGITSNLFMIMGKRIYTPSISTGLLPGITRAFVMKLAEQSGFGVVEKEFSLAFLLQADEIFLTNSTQEIIQVTEINHLYKQISFPITELLQKEYRTHTKSLRAVNHF